MVRSLLACLFPALLLPAVLQSAEPLHRQIDRLVQEKAKDKPVSPRTTDAEFLRRVTLDLSGTIPTAEETRAFLKDTSPDKRAKLIDKLMASPEYPRRMADLFHVMLMERMGDNPAWTKFLRTAFERNRPWDQLAGDILKADRDNEATKGAAFFIAKRLDKVGQQTIDMPGLTRDIGRLFLGRNLQCAQCHDHLFIDEYKQEHFQGLFAFVQNVYIVDLNAPSIAENATTEKVSFMSVFKKVNKQIGPSLPNGKEIAIPAVKKGEGYATAPNPRQKVPGVPKFSTLAQLAETVTATDNKDFSRNMANRLWFILMGRGLVHPLDLHHAENPASQPEVLDLIANEFATRKFDMKWLIRELALTETYQRTSVLPTGQNQVAPESFLTAIEKKVTAEQLLSSMLQATGERKALEARRKPETNGTRTDPYEILLARFQKAFANPAREPEEEFNPSLRAALFLLNDPTVLEWLTVRPGNLMERVTKISENSVAIDEIYLSVLTRLPDVDEKSAASAYLGKRTDKRDIALSQLAWALLASTEFSVNH